MELSRFQTKITQMHQILLSAHRLHGVVHSEDSTTNVVLNKKAYKYLSQLSDYSISRVLIPSPSGKNLGRQILQAKQIYLKLNRSM